MELPGDIETQIIDYLNIEYGASEVSEMLRPSDLEYEGEFIVDGKRTKYWKFPSSEKSGCWATVEPYGKGYLFSIATSLPNQIEEDEK